MVSESYVYQKNSSIIYRGSVACISLEKNMWTNCLITSIEKNNETIVSTFYTLS